MEAEDEEDGLDRQITMETSGANVTSLAELQKQQIKLEFDIAVKSVSILRYIADHATRYKVDTSISTPAPDNNSPLEKKVKCATTDF